MNGQSAGSVFSRSLTKEGNSFMIMSITRRKENQTDCLQDVQMASIWPGWPQTSYSFSVLFSIQREWFQQCPCHKAVMKSTRDNKGSKPGYRHPQVCSIAVPSTLDLFLSSSWSSHFGVWVFHCQITGSVQKEGRGWPHGKAHSFASAPAPEFQEPQWVAEQFDLQALLQIVIKIKWAMAVRGNAHHH